MKTMSRFGLERVSRMSLVALCLLFATPGVSHASIPELTGNKMVDGIVSTVIYSLVGIIMAFLSFRVIDWILPGCLRDQLTEDKNVAVGLVAGGMILGVCIIIAATLVG